MADPSGHTTLLHELHELVDDLVIHNYLESLTREDEELIGNLLARLPDDLEEHEVKATLLVALGRRDEARPYYDKLLGRLSPWTMKIWARRGKPSGIPWPSVTDVNIKGEALYGAAVAGNLEIVTHLVFEEAADVFFRYDEVYYTVAIAAVEGGNMDVIKFFYRQGVNFGGTTLGPHLRQLAEAMEHREVVTFLNARETERPHNLESGQSQTTSTTRG